MATYLFASWTKWGNWKNELFDKYLSNYTEDVSCFISQTFVLSYVHNNTNFL